MFFGKMFFLIVQFIKELINDLVSGNDKSESLHSSRSNSPSVGLAQTKVSLNFFNQICSLFAYFNKLYFTTSFIFILTFSSENSDTGTKFINRGCSRNF